MFGSGITISLLLIYLVQLGMLPDQIINSFSRRFDITSKRFLIFSLAFIAYNSNWIILALLGYTDSYIYDLFELSLGFVLMTYFYLYILKEMGIKFNFYKPKPRIIYILFSVCLCYITLGKLTYFGVNFLSFIIYLVFQVLALYYGIRTIRIILIENEIHQPIFYSAIVSLVIGTFVPSSQFFLESEPIKYLITNVIYFVLLAAYLMHRFNQMKSESKVLVKHSPYTVSYLNESVLRIEGLEKLTDTYGLSPRQLEVAELILTNCRDKDIATRLFITEGAVRKHASNIYEKVGISRHIKKKRSHFKKMFISQVSEQV